LIIEDAKSGKILTLSTLEIGWEDQTTAKVKENPTLN
jgi:hypothetical protein